MTKKRIFEISLIIGLCFSFLLSLVGFDAECARIKDNVFRIHILANSDSQIDQNLKLKVRDKILAMSEKLYENAECKEDAINITSNNMELLLNEAKQIINNNGFDYSVSGEVCKNYFDTRVYDGFTLPAGYYDSLKINIGKAEGKNWWCVLFPKVCLDACSDFQGNLSEKSEEIIENPTDYTMQFKIVEIYNKAKEKINSIFF